MQAFMIAEKHALHLDVNQTLIKFFEYAGGFGKCRWASVEGTLLPFVAHIRVQCRARFALQLQSTQTSSVR